MSKAGVNTTPNKQDNTQFKKENRTPNTTTPKDEKRQTSSDNFTNQGGRGHHGQQQHGNQQHHNQSQNRDRSGNRNDSHQFDRNAPDVKSNDKDDKSLAESSTAPVPDKKFTGRCRLFVGNLTPDVSEDEFRKMFEPYGEVSEMYVNTSRGFGFIRLDYRQNAEAAKAALDGLVRKGRVLRVRFASHGAALKVKNLHPYVSNELLEQSFSQFGDLERCVVIVDDRGKPTGEGIVEFVRKPGANSALRRITEGVFLMGADPKPLAVEPLEQKDEEDGLPEKFLTKTDQYKKEREKEPRFAPPGTFEYEFGMRWKQIEEIEKSRIEQVKKDTEDARLKLEDEMQNALYEYQAEQIRQDLRRQQEELLRLEELRNQDRMRRQQEHEIRRQQEERERAQQEERRRADTMMLMRQHEMARGRASMDMPGMRGRDDMMMVDRYGDRMPDRMGDRMPDRMPDRMGDRMPERMGDRMPERMGDRMPERMGERMPERMGERMPDRMGDRMPDRMGPGGQPGFMWDDKQRAEAGMRGDAGRGRGSGAPPLQPPPVPPSSVSLERGGPIAAASAGAAQGRKSSSPKPLMQGSGFGGPGAPAGSGPSSNPQNSSEVSAGDEDCVDETASCSHETEETDSTEWASDYSDLHETRPLSSWSAPIHSPVIHGEEVSCGVTISCQYHGECQSHLGIDETCTECTHQWETDQECIFCKGVEVAENSTHLLTRRLKSCGNETDCVDEVLSVIDLNHSEITSKIFSNQSNTYAGEDSEDSSFRCQGVEKSDLLSPVNDIKMEKANGVELTPVKPTPSHISCQEKCVGHGCSQNICDIPGQLTIGSFNNNSEEGDSQSVLSDSLGHYATCGNIKDAEISSPQCLSLNDPASNCCTVYHQESSGHSVGGSQNMQAEDSYQSSATAQLQQLSANQVQHSYPADQYELSQISEGCKYFPESNICNCIHVSRRDLDNSNYSAYKASNQTFITNKDNSNNEELKCKHSVDKGNLKGLSPMEESYDYQTIESRDGLLDYRERQCDKDILSYKQHHSSYTDRINNETIDVPCDINHPKEGSFPLSYQNADMTEQVDTSAESQYIPYDGQPAGWRSDDVSEDTVDSGTFLNSQVPDSETFTTNHNTVTQAFPLSSEDHEIASTCSSVASSHPSEENHEAVLCADDQTFKSVVLRRPIVVTSMPAGCSLSYMSDMNCSMYGSAVVQALGRPAVMSSSSIHFAKHAGSATMMQHQSMSAGLNGGMAHANIMRHQAVPNRAQTTSVLQHHSLINGGRAMVVQQRTMMTGVGGVAQQTVIQQRVAAPANMTQPAMMRVGAVRQRAFTPQQAGLIQQRGIRFVPSGVLGTPLLQSQTIQSTAVYEGRAAALMGQGLVSGVNQGHVMQRLVQQRYLGGPLMPGRGVQLVAGHPVRLVNK